ncbi:hypothetical protein [Natrinema sp. 1APR25-10V2]|uniref:DUF7853 family protein n=1 Tax=Natrinema sp. 1APR25-10V2 TaxID=2951081 RepID=UPI002875FF69|nr:hypothetical protein [Natrinema sp. 1APR25-10V2]MDS0474425.1 hypothetical protein [Natrinema sp. 1APR25-10V2]
MSTPAHRTIALPLSPDDLWALHHVLLERIEAELTATDASTVDPPPLAVYQAFETLEDGETRFTITQLEAIVDTLRHDSDCPPWCFDCARLAEVRHAITRTIEGHSPTLGHAAADD